MTGYLTTEVYISGAMCGEMWQGGTGCVYVSGSLRPFLARTTADSNLVAALRLFLIDKGNDLQNAQFTVDSVIRVQRHKSLGTNSYLTHIRTIPVEVICASIVNPECYGSDFN